MYKIPIYDWKKTKFLGVKLQKKLDYISLFPEKQFPNQPEELVKIYEKKKIDTPGPETYDMVRNWAKKGHHDYEQQRGRQYREDRETEVAQHMRKTKRAKLPAPNAYKPRRQSRILGPVNYE